MLAFTFFFLTCLFHCIVAVAFYSLSYFCRFCRLSHLVSQRLVLIRIVALRVFVPHALLERLCVQRKVGLEQKAAWQGMLKGGKRVLASRAIKFLSKSSAHR